MADTIYAAFPDVEQAIRATRVLLDAGSRAEFTSLVVGRDTAPTFQSPIQGMGGYGAEVQADRMAAERNAASEAAPTAGGVTEAVSAAPPPTPHSAAREPTEMEGGDTIQPGLRGPLPRDVPRHVFVSSDEAEPGSMPAAREARLAAGSPAEPGQPQPATPAAPISPIGAPLAPSATRMAVDTPGDMSPDAPVAAAVPGAAGSAGTPPAPVGWTPAIASPGERLAQQRDVQPDSARVTPDWDAHTPPSGGPRTSTAGEPIASKIAEVGDRLMAGLSNLVGAHEAAERYNTAAERRAADASIAPAARTGAGVGERPEVPVTQSESRQHVVSSAPYEAQAGSALPAPPGNASGMAGPQWGAGLVALKGTISQAVSGVGWVVGGGSLAQAVSDRSRGGADALPAFDMETLVRSRGVPTQRAQQLLGILRAGGALIAVDCRTEAVCCADARTILTRYGAQDVEQYAPSTPGT